MCGIVFISELFMWTVFEQIIILLIFVGVGYILGKSGIVKNEHSKVLSSLLVYVFLPCNVIKTFTARFNISFLQSNWEDILISSVIMLVTAIGAHFIVKLITKNKYERSVYEYSVVVPNSGYIGIALATSVFSAAGLMSFMTMAIPLQIYIYTYGYAILTKQGLNLKKLINPVIIATVLGIIFGLCNVKFPSLIDGVLDSSSACMAPVSMLLTGCIISEFKLKDMFSNIRIYPVIFLRILAIPLLVGLVLSLFLKAETVAVAVLLYALPCGMNSVIFPKLVGEDCRAGAGISLISTLLSALTIPLIFLIFNIG